MVPEISITPTDGPVVTRDDASSRDDPSEEKPLRTFVHDIMPKIVTMNNSTTATSATIQPRFFGCGDAYAAGTACAGYAYACCPPGMSDACDPEEGAQAPCAACEDG